MPTEQVELTELQKAERRALCGSRPDILVVVSAVRSFRHVLSWLMDQRYLDGECDAVALSQAFYTLEHIESTDFGLIDLAPATTDGRNYDGIEEEDSEEGGEEGDSEEGER